MIDEPVLGDHSPAALEVALGVGAAVALAGQLGRHRLDDALGVELDRSADSAHPHTLTDPEDAGRYRVGPERR